MKSCLAILLVSLISLTSISQIGCNNSTEPFEAVRAFCDQVGLDTFDDFILKSAEDYAVIRDLFWKIWEDFAQSGRGWIDTADSVSKIGRLMDLVASNIKENANNTRLNQQFDMVFNTLNDVMKNQAYFFEKLKSNLASNFMQIGWELFDLRNLFITGDYKEFGKRSGNLFLSIFKGTATPPTEAKSMRFLSNQENLPDILKTPFDSDCFTNVFNVLKELYECYMSPVRHVEEIYKILADLYRVLNTCVN